MIINVLTLFPEMFNAVTEQSILGRANRNEILNIHLVNIREYTKDKHNRTDDTPYGGGAGMVMSAEPVYLALLAKAAKGKRILYPSPKGTLLNQTMIEDLSKEKELFLVCGHYEGLDQRAIDEWNMEEFSIGDYILTGGELPAMVLIDAVARLIPDVLGSSDSHREESIYSGLLEYPHYTKPREFRERNVPDILLSGNHEQIHLWRFLKSLELTYLRRRDLYDAYVKQEKDLTKNERKVLLEFQNGKKIT